MLIALLATAFACSPAKQETPVTETSATTATTSTVTTETTTTSTDTSTTAAADTASTPTATSQGTPAVKKEKSMAEKVAEIHTSKGEIDIRFYPDVAPGHVKNFIELAESGFYNGTKFHRIIPGFMIQGGDPNTKTSNVSSWGTGGSGKNIKAEFSAKPHTRGIVSMARAQDPNSASSQFFIVVADSRFLDNQYSVFGEVLKGMVVADKIVSAPRGAQDRPNEPVSIEKIVIRDAKDGEIK
jgi:peptidyl-prolyl cis-trans isomerase B (cyclophilin B)